MISVVVPCYNEEKNICALVERFDSIKELLNINGFELILVDNGSLDNTSFEIDKQCEKYCYIRKVSVQENKGYGYGILQGLYAGKGEWLGWIHADLQLPPEAFVEMIAKIKGGEGKDKMFFKGRRKKRPLLDVLFTIGMGCFESIFLKEKLWDINAQPTLIKRDLLEKLKNIPFDFSFDLYIYYIAKKLGYEEIRIPVNQQPRREGESSWNNGMKARLKLIKRTLAFSVELKKRIEV